MPSAKDEAGKRYGKLIVIRRQVTPGKSEAYWLCHCDCGSETVVRGKSLRSGQTRSCGCLVSEIARHSKVNPLLSDLKTLGAVELCRKYEISESTVRRYRKKAGVIYQAPPDPIFLLSETEKAYLAGLIDADGYITVHTTRNTAYPNVGVAQTDFQALNWMADVLKATVSYHTRRKEGKSGYHKKQMIVRLHGYRARLLCEAILPYLKIKKRQAEIILQFPCDMRNNGLDDKTNRIRLSLQKQVQALNSRREDD